MGGCTAHSQPICQVCTVCAYTCTFCPWPVVRPCAQVVVAQVEGPTDVGPQGARAQGGGFGWEGGVSLREGDLLLLTRTNLKSAGKKHTCVMRYVH